MYNENAPPGGDEEEKVWPKDEYRDLYKSIDLLSCVHSMAKVKEQKEKLEDQLGKCVAHYDVLRLEVIPQKMEDAGVNSPFNVKGVGRVVLTGDMFVSTKKGMSDALQNWLRKHKLGDLIKHSVNSSTLKAFIKGRIKKGLDYPDEYLNITPVTRASITKGE